MAKLNRISDPDKMSFSIWFRNTSLLQKLIDLFSFLVAFTPTAIAVVTWRLAAIANTAGVKEIIIFALGVVATGLALLKWIESITSTQRLLIKSQEFQKGSDKTMQQWKGTATILNGALLLNYELSDPTSTSRQEASLGEAAISQHLQTIVTAVRFVFDGNDLGDVRANLCLLNSSATDLVVAMYGTAEHTASVGKKKPIKKQNLTPGAVTALISREPQYISSTCYKNGKAKKGYDASRPYRSFMSWPVRAGNNETVIGVVNIDSSQMEAFDADNDASRRKHAEIVARPALTGIALALLNSDVLKSYRA